MLARLFSTLIVLALVASAIQLSRPVALDRIELSEDARILGSSRLQAGAPVGAGDRVIAINGVDVSTAQQVEALIRGERNVDIRVLSIKALRSETIDRSMLKGELPELLLPTHFIVSIDERPTFGATSGDVARALQDHDSVRVQAVPMHAVFDGEVPVDRGVPPLAIILAAMVAVLSLAILWGMSLPLGIALGLGAGGAALWLVEEPVAARLVGLTALCLSAAFGAWTLLAFLPMRDGQQKRGRAKRYEGSNARPDLLAALHEAEEALGVPLYIVVGSAQQAVEIHREYERVSVEAAGSVLTSSLSMLALEGGVFPRADVGEGVPQVWDDPIHDLDVSAGIAAAVPIPAYGSSQDQWAFLLMRTKDTPSSTQLLEPLLATADWWVNSGLREAIAVQAAHGLLRLVREAKNTQSASPLRTESSPTSARKHEAGDSKPAFAAPAESAPTFLDTPAIAGAPEVVTNANLDFVSEGIGIPRVVKRADLEKERGAWTGNAAPEASATPAAVPTTARERLSTPGYALPTPAAAKLARSEQLLATERAWSGHLARRWEDSYPVDDPRLYSESDWQRLAKLQADEGPSLIFGEAGVGKEFAARALHAASERNQKPIAVVDCAHLSEAALELELFGMSDEPGVMAGIEGGALILKSPSKISRAALESTLSELGRYDVRLFLIERQAGNEQGVPAHTPTIIREKVKGRIAQLPPLRERPEDILPVAEVMLEELSSTYGDGEARKLDDMAERLLEAMDLPGNFWDLQSLLRSALLRADEDSIDVRSILGVSAGDVPRELAKIEADEERQRLVAALHETEGNKSEAARILGLSRGALLRRLKRHGLM